MISYTARNRSRAHVPLQRVPYRRRQGWGSFLHTTVRRRYSRLRRLRGHTSWLPLNAYGLALEGRLNGALTQDDQEIEESTHCFVEAR